MLFAVLCNIIVCIHPQFLPSLSSGPLFIPPILFPVSLLSFLLIYMLYFLIIHSSFLINLHSQRIYNALSQHCLYFFIFFQIAIFLLTMQQSIKDTWECEHAVQCGVKVAWVVVALKTSHATTLFFLQRLWWHCYTFDYWGWQTSKGWNQATKNLSKALLLYILLWRGFTSKLKSGIPYMYTTVEPAQWTPMVSFCEHKSSQFYFLWH